MWLKVAIGAVCGLVVGHFVEPGYPLWVVLGVAGGYGADWWSRRGHLVRRRLRL
ncbi:MAG TPA: hypothetical protein VF234_10015 [Limnochordia bacterium]